MPTCRFALFAAAVLLLPIGALADYAPGIDCGDGPMNGVESAICEGMLNGSSLAVYAAYMKARSAYKALERALQGAERKALAARGVPVGLGDILGQSEPAFAAIRADCAKQLMAIKWARLKAVKKGAEAGRRSGAVQNHRHGVAMGAGCGRGRHHVRPRYGFTDI